MKKIILTIALASVIGNSTDLSHVLGNYSTIYDLGNLNKIESLEKKLKPSVIELGLDNYSNIKNKIIVTLKKVKVVFHKENGVQKVAIIKKH